MPLEIVQIDSNSSDYPDMLSGSALSWLPGQISAIGDLAILQRPLLGFFCSARCPRDVILRTYDMARALRNAGVPVIGGFHSSMEKECLDLLLRGKQPIVVCPARAIQRMRIPAAWRGPIEASQLLVLSPFEEKHRRATAELGEQRNLFVATLAADTFIAHAGPESKTERLCHEILESGKPVRVLDVADNQPLIAAGAAAFRIEDVGMLPGGEGSH